MKKITQVSLIAVTMLFAAFSFAQSTVTGTVMDADLNAPLPGANVIEKGTTNGVSTNFDGEFTLSTQASSGEVEISFVGYATITLSFNGNTDLGTITLSPDNSLEEVVIIGSGIIDLAEDRQTPVAVSTVTKSEIQERAVGNVELPEVIKYTPSVFVSNQTGFGDGSLFLRGFDDTNTAVLLNGQPINAQEDGRVFWSNWAGMADIANAVQVQRGLGSSKLAISSVGGTVNIVMKAAEKRQGGSVRFLTGNDSYFKGTAEYNTGINDKGWAFSVLLDHWQAHRKWGRGTFGQGQNYFFSVGYQPNDQHAFNFLITGAPQYHGQKWSQNEETTLNDPLFNQHWGYTQNEVDGNYTTEIDSERRNFYHKPVANLNWDWNISDESQLSTVLYASWGRGGGTGPRGDRLRTADGQLDYFGIEQANAAIGTGGFDSPETGYIRRGSMNNHSWYGLVSNFNHQLSENFSFNVGTDIRFYRGDHFRQIVDLYGLNAWVEDGVSYTQTFDADPWAALSNFADEDQRIDYDYSENINYQGLFAQGEYATDKFSVFLQAAVSNQSYQREGRHISESNPGKSDKLSKTGYNIKGGSSFAINKENKLFVNAGYYSRQPYLDNVFTNIRRNNEFVSPEVENEDITGIEAGYQFETNGVRAMFNFYYTDWDNRVLLSGGTLNQGTPNEVNVNFFDRGVRQVHRGVEFELDTRISDRIDFGGFISAGSWEFKGTSNRDVYDDDSGQLLSSETGVNRDGVKVTTAPQFTAGLNTKIKICQGLSIDGNLKFYGNHYPDARDFDSTPQTENEPTLDPFNLADFGLTYVFNLGDDKITFRGNVFNAFDKRGIQDTDVFGSFPITGRTFNTSIRYHF